MVTPSVEYSELTINRLYGATLASFAVASGSFFIRTNDNLYRIGGFGSGFSICPLIGLQGA